MSTRVAPIFPVRDVAAALAYYRGLGFGARQWHGGGYGFLIFDGAEGFTLAPSLTSMRQPTAGRQPTWPSVADWGRPGE